MADKISTDQYGRKQWDVEAYAAEAKNKHKNPAHATENDEASDVARKLLEKGFTEHRSALLGEAVASVGKHTLIGSERASTSSTYGKNKRFGFACPTCDLSFRDTLALVDHFNSPQHLKNVQRLQKHEASESGSGESELPDLEGGIKRASAAQVIAKLEDLVKESLRKKMSAKSDALGSVASLQERVQKRVAFEKNKARLKSERKKRKLLRNQDTVEETEMGKMMGFEGFGTTKAG